MMKFFDWWIQDKRYLLTLKALLAALLPVLCCLVTCAVQGRSIGEVYLPNSEWNDELFYFKQVEAIVNYGYPLGYFGFNESHALKLSFAAWSPVLVFPWILWGLVFGWNLLSPIVCNIFLLSAAMLLFVLLVRPTWKQEGILALLFCLYTPFVRYMLSGMPEIICFSMLIVFYGLAVSYIRREKGYKLVILLGMGVLMTWMRPYLLLFLLLPLFFWVRRNRIIGLTGSLGVLAAALGGYALIKHYLGAEYFADLFFTDWVKAFFETGLFGGIRYTLGKLYYMGKAFAGHTLQGFRTGLASGAFFAGYLAVMAVLLVQTVRDLQRTVSRRKQGAKKGGSPQAEKERSPQEEREGTSQTEKEGRCLGSELLIVEAHLLLSFIGMFLALLLMYKLTEGSKHLLTFIAVGIFIVSLMDTRFYKKAAFLGVVFVYFYTYMALDPYDYQVPFVTAQRQDTVEQVQSQLKSEMQPDVGEVPGYGNVVIWTFSDEVDGENRNTPWQLLYALPEGMGISCCYGDYVMENIDRLQSRYIAANSGGEVDALCREKGFQEILRSDELVMYKR